MLNFASISVDGWVWKRTLVIRAGGLRTGQPQRHRGLVNIQTQQTRGGSGSTQRAEHTGGMPAQGVQSWHGARHLEPGFHTQDIGRDDITSRAAQFLPQCQHHRHDDRAAAHFREQGSDDGRCGLARSGQGHPQRVKEGVPG